MKTSRSAPAVSALVTALCLLPAMAQAHPSHGGDFAAGVTHPFMGWDHLLAMLAVGLWAAQLGGRARWAVPGAFVAVMSAGGAIGMAGFRLSLAEPAILTSVMLLGLMILTACRMHLVGSIGLVSAFAFFHGLAHGAELPVNGNALLYTVGFALATATLHGIGLAAASLTAKGLQTQIPLRFAGAAVAVGGAILTFR
jgi:urease accessory protein